MVHVLSALEAGLLPPVVKDVVEARDAHIDRLGTPVTVLFEADALGAVVSIGHARRTTHNAAPAG